MQDQTQRSTALVTGATGFIGGHLVRRLLDNGWYVRILVRTPGDVPEDMREQCDIIKGDLADTNALSMAVRNIAVIFHCAANVKTWDTWEAYYDVNVSGVRNLLGAILSGNPLLKRLVHVSTVDVYGYPVAACTEESALRGGGFGYGESKCLGEGMVRSAGQKDGIPFTIIRPTNVIGPGSQFIERMGCELQRGVMLTVDGGRVNAGLVYVDNLVNYMIWAALSEKASGEIYNVRDPYDISWKNFLEIFQAAILGKGLVINLPMCVAMGVAKLMVVAYKLCKITREPLLHPLLVYMFGRTCGHDATKIRQHSGLLPVYDFNQAMMRSVDWFIARYGKS